MAKWNPRDRPPKFLNWTDPKTVEKFRDALERTRSVKAIAAEMGVSCSTVNRRLDEYLALAEQIRALRESRAARP